MGNNSHPTKPAPRPAPQVPPSRAPQGQLGEMLSRGEAAARVGDREGARRLFQDVLALDPANEDAWLWLAYLAPTQPQRLDYLRAAATYHPTSQRVRQAEEWAEAQQQSAVRPIVTTGRSPSAEVGELHEEQSASRQASPIPEEATGQPPISTVARTSLRRPPARTGDASGQRSPAMARPQGQSRPAVVWTPPLIAMIVVGLLLIGVVLIYGLRGQASGRGSARPTPVAFKPISDMGSLREQADRAISGEAWEQAIPLLENIHQLSPDDDGVLQQLAVAHLRRGLQLVELDRLEEAIVHYDAAIRFYANDMDLQVSRRLAVGALNGRRAVESQRWDEAIELLEPVYKLAPGFRNVPALLFSAYLEKAKSLEAAGQLAPARSAYARAVETNPSSQEAQAKLTQITIILTPPTPTPTPAPHKRILVDVSQQRLWAYEDEKLVFNWVCSTGAIATPTQFGTYEILDKIPEAWSSVWGLRMPYWMGIYWAGGSENGIHALPIRKNGTTLWSGYLGTRISYGCIVLSTANAAKLYNWAEIGTTVVVTE